MSANTTPDLSRRRFLASGAAAGATAVIGTVGGGVLASTGILGRPATVSATGAPASGVPVIIPFEGIHQAGIDRPGVAQPNAVLAAFDVVATDSDDLRLLFAELTRRIRDLTAGTPPPPIDAAYPPPESGVLGPSIGPASLTITVAVGASLFDERYGLTDRKPIKLRAMPHFRGDVIDASRAHGDLLVQVCAVDEMACLHALRYLMVGTRAQIALRWMEHGFQRPDVVPAEGKTTTRNLLGFKDGTANPPVSGDDFSNSGVGDRRGRGAGMGGRRQLHGRAADPHVRGALDRAPLAEQETIIGRTKRTGAPLDGQREEDTPDFAADPEGTMTAVDAHIRLANPRTPETESNRIFRRGYSFSRGFDDAGLLDQGLAFVCFQHDIDAGFVTIQDRLDNEPLLEYIQPQGGGFFFALPGVVEPDGILGGGLLGERFQASGAAREHGRASASIARP